MSNTTETETRAIAEINSLLQKDGIKGSEVAKQLSQERWRSMVRVVVTYMVTLTYLLIAAGMVIYLLKCGKIELAIGVFSSIAAASGTIIGFWFGTRGQGGSAGDQVVKPLTALIEAGGKSDEITLVGEPAVAASSAKVKELQNLLAEYSTLLPEGRLRASVDPGGVDGIMGESTIAAVDNFLSMMDPPDQFEDLAEPRVDTVIAIIKREIAARRAAGGVN